MKFALSSLMSLSFCFAVSAHAETARVDFDGMDIAPAVRYYEKQVKTLAQPIKVYTWSTSGADPYWSVERSAGDEANVARNTSRSFWQNYGSKEGSSNMYGYGLYAALDPVTTHSYGLSTWLMQQSTFPAGMRLIDLALYQENPSDPDYGKTAEIMQKFKCPGVNTDPLFVSGGVSLDTQCRRLVQKIFDAELKIQAFAYSYSDTPFKVCKMAANRAFVITRSEWIQPGLVSYFTETTTQKLEDRRLIQTLFLESIENTTGGTGWAMDFLKMHLMDHPEYIVKSSTSKCDDKNCVITAKLCVGDSDTCTFLELPPIRRKVGGLITASDAAKSSRGKLLWKDLEGQDRTPDLTDWLIQYKFGCSGQLPYVTSPVGTK